MHEANLTPSSLKLTLPLRWIFFFFSMGVSSEQILFADFTRPDKKGKPIHYVIMKPENEMIDVRNLFLLSSIHNFRRLSLGSFEHSMRALHPSLETLGDVVNLMREDFKAEETLFREAQVIWVGAYLRNALIGWVSFQKVPLPHHGVFVSKLYVDPEFQNRGVGKTLLLSVKTDSNLLPQTKKLYLTTHLAYRDSIRL